MKLEVLTDEPSLSRFLETFRAYKGAVVYDVETDGLYPYKDNKIIGYAFCLPPRGDYEGHAAYIPVRHNRMAHRCVRWKPLADQPTARKKLFPENQLRFPDGIVYELIEGKNHPINLNLDPTKVRELLAPFFIDGRMMIGFNIKFDKHFTEQEGIVFTNPTHDVMLDCHLDDENAVSFAMDAMGPKYCGVDASKNDKALLEWAKTAWRNKRLAMKTVKGRLKECPLFMVGEYGAFDCVLTYQIFKKVKKNLEAQNLFPLAKEIATDYAQAIQRMERAGVMVDQERAKQSMAHAEQRIEGLYEAMVKVVGYEFNPGSNEQIAKILYNWEPSRFTNTFVKDGKVVKKVIKSRHPSTDKAALSRSDHELVPLLEEYREWKKSITTYYRPWLTMCDACGRLHPNIALEGTVAGRCSCRSPNMQNLPRVDERTVYDCRGAIIAAPGNILLSRDYSQIELRVATEYSQDPTWLEVYASGGDIHQATADALCAMGVNVTRQDAKTINFAMLYNMGPPALSSKLKISEAKAKSILQAFKYSKPRLVKLQKDVERAGRDWGYIELWTGRRRHYPEQWRSWMVSTALNNLIQGGAAEIMRHAIMRLDKLLLGSNCKMILQIHDDILFEMPEDELTYWNPKIRAVMDDWNFRVPIVSEGKAGRAWNDMVKCDETFKAGDVVECSFAYEPEKTWTGVVIERDHRSEFIPIKDTSIDVKIDGKTNRSVLCGTDTIKRLKEVPVARAA